MHLCHHLRALKIVGIILQQQLTGFLIQRRLRIRLDEETANRDKDMLQTERLVPILLQSADTDLTRLEIHIWMKDFGEEPTLRCRLRIVTWQL